MKKFDLKKAILENKATFNSSLNEAEGLTPLQDYVYQYEIEISGEDQAQEFLDDIKKLNTPGDVYDYYAYERDWQGSMDDDLESIYKQVKRKFSKLGEGYDEFKRADKGSKDVTAKDKGEEEVYGAGVKKGEEIEKKKLKENSNKPTTVPELIFQIQKKYPRMNWLESELPNNPTFQDVKGTLEDAGYGKVYDEFMGGDMADRMTDLNETNTKMKKSELKAKIKEMIVAEMNLDINDETPESEEDFLAEVEAILAEADEVAVDDTEVAVGGAENIDVNTTVEVDPNVKAVQDALTQAQAAAQKLGDKKLTDQIGNTITFFTRTHVVEKPGATV